MRDGSFRRLIRELRKQKELASLTPEEAEKAYAEAPAVPIPEGRIRAMVEWVTSPDRGGGDERRR